MNLIDSSVKWTVDRISFARSAWIKAVSSNDRALTSSFLPGESTDTWDEDKRIRVAAATSWIYADIRLLGQEVSAASLEVKQKVGEQRNSVPNHPAEQLLDNPNPLVDMLFIWQYTIWWLNLRGDAYLFLAPEAGNENKIAEIWPVPADRITPIPDRFNLIKAYAYKMPGGSRKLINPKYIVHFQLPSPFSLIDGMAPLSAAALAMETEQGISGWQRDTYISGRGIPHSIISVDPDMGERDFIAVSSQIRNDFQEERKVIITRAGDLKVGQVGLSQKEMDLVGQREFTRNELDVIFLGLEYHSSPDLDKARKALKEATIHPLHKLLAGQLTLQLIHPYYGNDYFAEFEDIRAQDRSLNIQERNVYWRAKTLDEARRDLNLAPYSGEFDGMGELLVVLAGDPQFVMAKYGLGVENLRPDEGGIVEPTRKKPTPTAAMNESDAPVNVASDAAKTAAEIEGILGELNRYRKVASKAIKSGNNPGLIHFSTEVLPNNLKHRVRGELLEVERTEEALKSLFETYRTELKAKRGRQRKEIEAVDRYQAELISEYEDWADEWMDELGAGEDDALVDEKLALLLLLLIALGRKRLPDALELALGKESVTPDMLERAVVVMRENERYLTESLIPDLRAKLKKAYSDPDIQIAISGGDGPETVRAVLQTVASRVGMYAGEMWDLYNYTFGLMADEKGRKVFWARDENADHCQTCLDYGDREYESFAAMLVETGGISPANGTDCLSRCRCHLRFA